MPDLIPHYERPRIYISGPITKGDRNHNYYQAVQLQKKLMLNGFAPLNPMMTAVVPFAWEEDMVHDLWLECDYPYIAVSDAVFRLWGESDGANKETAFADTLGIPVFTSYPKLKKWREEEWLPRQITKSKPNPTQTQNDLNEKLEENLEESSSTKNKKQNSKPPPRGNNPNLYNTVFGK